MGLQKREAYAARAEPGRGESTLVSPTPALLHSKERDLIAQFGERYRRYREQAGMLLPKPGRRTTEQVAPSEERSLS
jgi:hypothetical protein